MENQNKGSRHIFREVKLGGGGRKRLGGGEDMQEKDGKKKEKDKTNRRGTEGVKEGGREKICHCCCSSTLVNCICFIHLQTPWYINYIL